MPDLTGELQANKRNGRFRKGQSGNPAGRPKGAVGRVTELRQVLDESGAEIVQKLVELAKSGDRLCLRLVIDRVLPVRHDRAVLLDGLQSRSVRSAEEIIEATSLVIRHAAAGEISLEEAQGFLRLVEQQRKAIETSELAVRLQLLESQGTKSDDDDRWRR